MQRRQLLAGIGGAAAVGSLAVGSGAFTSASANRHVTVDTADDTDALLSLVPTLHYVSGSDIVTEQDGVLTIDVGANGASGVNADATTWIGTPDYEDPSGWVSEGDDGYDNWQDEFGDRDHSATPKAAFGMVNFGTQPYELAFTYDFDETPSDASITFHVYDGWQPSGGPRTYGTHTFPDDGTEQLIVPTGGSGDSDFTPGKRIFTSLEIDTNGSSAAEDLSGDLTISARTPD
jgi:hypothetical protein